MLEIGFAEYFVIEGGLSTNWEGFRGTVMVVWEEGNW
jgi:hypothetical protein